jgi:hypothetical protein
MELIDYLNKHFFTQAQLLAWTGIAVDELEDLQRRRMMPLPSYRLRLDATCHSFFGEHAERIEAGFYAKGSPAWIEALRSLGDEAGAYALFARRYRHRLAQLAEIAPAADLTGEAHIASEWKHFVDGTYGLCTVSGLPEDIAAKEAAIVVIRALCGREEQALTDVERQRLRAAVDLLDSVSKPFAPHEVARSSRRKYVDEVRTTYGP